MCHEVKKKKKGLKITELEDKLKAITLDKLIRRQGEEFEKKIEGCFSQERGRLCYRTNHP